MENRWCDMIEQQIAEVKANQDRLWLDMKAEWLRTQESQISLKERVDEMHYHLFNGFDKMVKETHSSSIEIKEQINLLARTVGLLNKEVYKSPAQQLADCPFKKELKQGMEKRIKIYLTVFGLVIALVASVPSWIRVFIGG